MVKKHYFIAFVLSRICSVSDKSLTTCSGSHSPKGPFNSGELIFEDHFNNFDLEVWSHEQTLSGGGVSTIYSNNNNTQAYYKAFPKNWEFQWYTNSKHNSYVKDGKLFIKPTIVADETGEDFLESGTISLSGANQCTDPTSWGCERTGSPTYLLNSVKSARIHTLNSFNFKYGKVEISAKLPTGDWLWPALWLLPKLNQYSAWPASGEIDLMESRGNRNYTSTNGEQIGTRRVGQTLHWGPVWNFNKYYLTTVDTINSNGYDDGFHLYQFNWTPDGISFAIDNALTCTFSPPSKGFWAWGEFDSSGYSNPWISGSKMAPFDQEFYLIINLACGGTFYFPDDGNNAAGPKPWSNTMGVPSTDFWHGKDQWLPTWQLETDSVAFQIDYVKVWAFELRENVNKKFLIVILNECKYNRYKKRNYCCPQSFDSSSLYQHHQ